MNQELSLRIQDLQNFIDEYQDKILQLSKKFQIDSNQLEKKSETVKFNTNDSRIYDSFFVCPYNSNHLFWSKNHLFNHIEDCFCRNKIEQQNSFFYTSSPAVVSFYSQKEIYCEPSLNLICNTSNSFSQLIQRTLSNNWDTIFFWVESWKQIPKPFELFFEHYQFTSQTNWKLSFLQDYHLLSIFLCPQHEIKESHSTKTDNEFSNQPQTKMVFDSCFEKIISNFLSYPSNSISSSQYPLTKIKREDSNDEIISLLTPSKMIKDLDPIFPDSPSVCYEFVLDFWKYFVLEFYSYQKRNISFKWSELISKNMEEEKYLNVEEIDRINIISEQIRSSRVGGVLPPEPSDLIALDSIQKEFSRNEKSDLQYQRDLKRRRSYRAKNVHITKRTPTQIARDIINNRMEQLFEIASQLDNLKEQKHLSQNELTIKTDKILYSKENNQRNEDKNYDSNSNPTQRKRKSESYLNEFSEEKYRDTKQRKIIDSDSSYHSPHKQHSMKKEKREKKREKDEKEKHKKHKHKT